MGRLARLTLGGVLLACAAAAPVHAEWMPYGTAEFEEGEIEQFMESLYYGFRSCDTEWVAAQFLPGAKIYFIHADGTRESFAPSEYAKLPVYCRPFQAVRWENKRSAYSYTTTGSRSTVRSHLEWGGEDPKRQGRPKVIFEEWTELVKVGSTVRIAGARSQARNLVPGGEEEFYLKTYGGDALYPLYKLSLAIGKTVSGLLNGIRRLAQGKNAPPRNQTDSTGHAVTP